MSQSQDIGSIQRPNVHRRMQKKKTITTKLRNLFGIDIETEEAKPEDENSFTTTVFISSLNN